MNSKNSKKSHNSRNLPKFDYLFSCVSKYTGFALGLYAAFTLTVKDDPQGVHLIPLAELFVQAAQIEVVEKNRNGEPKHPDHSNKKR
jgi:hypothetical protein